MLRTKAIISGTIFVIVTTIVLQTGCDPVKRYKLLSFFFDGVPSPYASKVEIAPEDANAVIQLADADVEGAPLSQIASSRHEPANDCDQCHIKEVRRTGKKFRQPLPQLCYRCHSDYTKTQTYVHGPVAVGDCLFCHDPHQSNYVKLQKAPQPQLCYQCHDPEEIAAIKEHRKGPMKICTYCHDPHAGSARKLLKKHNKNQTNTGTEKLSE